MVFLNIETYVINTKNITYYKRESHNQTKIFFVGGQHIVVDMEFEEFKNTIRSELSEDRAARKQSFSPSGGRC